MTSKEHDQPALAVNVAIGQSVAQSLNTSGNKTVQAGSTSQQKPRSVTISPLLVRDPRTSQPVTLNPAAINTALQALVKAQQANAVPLQPKQGSLPPRVSTSSKPSSSNPASKPVNLNVKVINPDKKSESQTFVLRNLSGSVSSPTQLRKEILKQFGPELVPEDLDFPVGYMRGGNKVWIRTATDVQDVWSFVHGCESVSLWCHGVPTSSSKSKRQKEFSSESDSDSDDSKYRKRRKKKKRKRSAFEEKVNRVEELVTKLRQKHGSRYNTIQYRIWAEVADVGSHESLDDPPDHPAFKAGRDKKPNQVQALTTAVTEMAKAMTSAGSSTPVSVSAGTPPSGPTPTAGISPGKIANLRSNYLQQMRDLHSLFENGAITECEFQEQKLTILEHLKKLSAS